MCRLDLKAAKGKLSTSYDHHFIQVRAKPEREEARILRVMLTHNNSEHMKSESVY
jgi:hypothetical protein